MNPIFQQILLPTDFSISADNALQYAYHLTKKLQGHLRLIHAFHMPISMDRNAKFQTEKGWEQMKREDSDQMQLATNRLNQLAGYPMASFDNEIGLLLDVIKNKEKDKEMDLILMGTKGAWGIDEELVGSNTAHVIETSKVPVLVIPEKATYRSYKKIMLATDFQVDDVEAIGTLANFAQFFEAELVVVHISDDPKGDAEDLSELQGLVAKRLNYPKLSFYNIQERKSTLDTLFEIVQEEKVDMLAMSSSGKNLLQRFWSKSLTRKMAFHTDVPFLAFHVKENQKL
jgi:nucleotide-binding universal stress UspA family protein